MGDHFAELLHCLYIHIGNEHSFSIYSTKHDCNGHSTRLINESRACFIEWLTVGSGKMVDVLYIVKQKKTVQASEVKATMMVTNIRYLNWLNRYVIVMKINSKLHIFVCFKAKM